MSNFPERPPSPSMPDWRDSQETVKPITDIQTTLESASIQEIDRKTSYLHLWQRVWNEFSDSSGYRPMKIAVVVTLFILLSVFGLSYFVIGKFLFPLLPLSGWAIVGLAALVLSEGFAVHFLGRSYERSALESSREHESQLKQRDSQIEVSQGQVRELEERLSAKPLVVSYDGGKHDRIETDADGKIIRRVIRVQVENTGDVNIDGIQAKAEHFVGDSASDPLVPLRIAYDRPNGFSLSPGNKELVDVVERETGSEHVRLCRDLTGPEMRTRADKFKVTVVLTANELKPDRKKLRIRKDDAELLHCTPLK